MIWNFQRYRSNSMLNFQGLIKNVKSPVVDQENIIWNFTVEVEHNFVDF